MSGEASQGAGSDDGRRELEARAGWWPIGRALTVSALAGLGLVLVLGFPRVQGTKELPLKQLLDALKLLLGTGDTNRCDRFRRLAASMRAPVTGRGEIAMR
ncbi:hypothetical protein ACIBF1_30070 [Spirillospora sp. NPDC050679]